MTKEKNSKEQKIKNPKTLKGVVVSSKMKDTIVVEVSDYKKHPKYKKYLSIQKKFKVHDPGNTKKEGEKVVIVETRPISKDKHFKLKE